MIEPLSKRVNDLGWHIQINASPETIMEIMPINDRGFAARARGVAAAD
jgi:hypothetical protein